MVLLVFNPLLFLTLVALNLALYGPGVLLIREAIVRWGKGWGSVLALGAAYGIFEEGIVLNTMFNPSASVVGILGHYGHWIGVNWVWVPGVLMVHMVLSIAVPILLLHLALPETRGKNLLGPKGVPLALVVLGVDGFVLWFLVGYWVGFPIFLLALLFIGMLVVLARRLPRAYSVPSTIVPKRNPWAFGLLGGGFFPILFLTDVVGEPEPTHRR